MFEMDGDGTMSDTVLLNSPNDTQEEIRRTPPLTRANADAHKNSALLRRDSYATSSMSPSAFFARSASLPTGTPPRSRTGSTADNVIYGGAEQHPDLEEQFAMSSVRGSSLSPGRSEGKQ